MTINLGSQPWRFFLGDPPGAAQPNFTDTSWKQVGIPYSPDDLYSFINAESGGGDGSVAPGSVAWYRTPIVLGQQYANRKVLVELEGAHTGVQVYINGKLLPGISQVTADAQATHVVGFIPVIVDLTPYLTFDGTAQNVLAIRVARNATWFEDPNFAEGFRFGQGFLGLFRPVKMFITDKVHIPENVYSNLKTWGTHVSTLAASDASAQVDVQTNVVNEGTAAQQVTVTTQIVDASGNVVATGQSTQNVAPSALPQLAPQLFDQQLTVTNPTLWYPNNSIYGKPYMYKVFHSVSIDGQVVDAAESPLGIRTITWDANFPYFNGKQQYLWGASGRYDYPAMASAVPEEQQWRDLQQLAAAGGNLWRPGHSSPSEEFVAAADAYGIMIVDPSGEGEGAFLNPCDPSCDKAALKIELHRDLIIRDRNHPSILSWEADNGQIQTAFAQTIQDLVNTWDPGPVTRVQADRTPSPKNGFILGCTLAGCEVGVKTGTDSDGATHKNNPAWGAEYWDHGTARQAWDYELAYAEPFLEDWRNGRANDTFGMAQWYFAESPGESNLYVEGTAQNTTRALGASMVDANRFPKLLYYIYEAAWTPYSIKPVVHLAHHWNRTGTVQVNAFSNCPRVRLLLNGVPQGDDQTPNPWDTVNLAATAYPAGDSTPAELQASAQAKQQTTQIPFQVSWSVNYAPGTLTAQCLDDLGNVASYGGAPVTDTRVTAGAPDHIVLSVVPELTRPDSTSFALTANGSDAAFVVAQVMDANGNPVPTDNTDNLTFSVNGPATYKGGTEAYVSTGTDAFVSSSSNPYAGSGSNGPPENAYHSPGDPELQVEGGLTKVVVRSQFTPGTVTVTATAPGLRSGSTTYTIEPAVTTTSPVPAAPEIIGQPSSTAVTAGQPAQFSVLATGAAPLSFQWSKNGAPIAGATSGTYTTPATSSADNNASYTVSVSNSFDSKLSDAATLTVDPSAAITITTQPQTQSAFAGQSASFSVAATGSPTLTYQWKLNNAAIAGATGTTYTTPVLAAGSAGAYTQSYTVAITNPVGTVTSSAATLTVNPATAPVITAQPQNLPALANQPASFSVTVTGTAPLVYQWFKGNAALSGATASSFTIASVQAADAGTYSVTISNGGGSVGSGPATLTLLPPGPNLALNQPATAFTQNGNGYTPASFAFDGNLGTRWDSVEGTAADPFQWLQVSFSAKQTFNTVVLYWDSAFASAFQMQSSNDGKTWASLTPTLSGQTGGQTISFPAATAQYLRMYSTARATAYGVSVDEMQVYNVPACTAASDPNERYTVLSGNTTVRDNLTSLTWDRIAYTLPGTDTQFTQPLAANYCANQNMRLPTQAEALGIAGANLASCAYPQAWSTWTSTGVAGNTSQAYIVGSSGTSTPAVATNYPGAVLCVSGTATSQPAPPPVAPAPSITTQPAPQTIAVGQSATFQVAATGSGTLTYQWSKNNTPISGATGASYTTPAAAATDTGSSFSAVVTSSNGTSTASASAVLTVTSASSGGGTGSTGTDVLAIAAGRTAAVSGFAADAGFSGGGAYATDAPVSIAGVANAAPAAIYQSERAGAFAYTVPGLTPGSTYGVRLHFAEIYWTQAAQRIFNVAINGTMVLPNLDIVKMAGGPNIALVEMFSATANADGKIIINLTSGSVDQPKISGFEILSTAPVTITAQPAAQTIALGNTATFGVTATASSGTVSYQWLKNGSAIAGATSASYQTPSTTAADNGALFSVIVSAGGGTLTSNTALLTIPAASATGTDVLAIASGRTAAVSGFAADAGFSGGGAYATDAPVSIAGVANAAPAAIYQSERAGVFAYTVPGLTPGSTYGVRLHFAEIYWTQAAQRIFNVAINGTMVLPNLDIVKMAGGPNIALVETFPATANADGKIIINLTSGSVDQPKISGFEILSAAAATGTPTITTQPAPQTVVAGAAATFSVAAGGAGPFTYQWSKNGTNIAGATAATYTTPSTVAADNGSTFSVVVANTAGSVFSANALLTVTAAPSGVAPTITAQPAAQTVTVGRTAQFSVTPAGTAPFTYQWSKNGTPIAGAISATYTTAGTSASDNNGGYSVVVANAIGSVTSNPAVLTVSTANPSTALYPGFLATDLNNNTNGVWQDNQIYVEVIGSDPTNKGALAWVSADGTRHTATTADNTAANHLTGPDGKSYPAFNFTLAQSKLLKLPPGSGRIYISMGQPMYMPVTPAGANGIYGYAGPNPQNGSDPNINTHYDWYEYTSGLNADGTNNIYINTTQVDYFGLPLLLDVWDGKDGITLGGVTAGHGQTGINESIASIDAEFAAQTPSAFHLAAVSNLRIPSPGKSTFISGQPNATYFDSYVNTVWSYYATNSLPITLGDRHFTGSTQGANFVFTETNPVAGAAGATYPIGQPTTENVVACDGVFNADTFSSLPSTDPRRSIELGLETALCATLNRHIVQYPAQWATPADYYLAAPANYYAQFWHNHSVGALAYGFPYDDFDGFSSTVVSFAAQRMAFGIGW